MNKNDQTPFRSLTTRVVTGSTWALSLRFSVRALGALQLVILARLLLPEEFGLFAIALMMYSAFDVLTRTGFNDAIINKRKNIESFIHTAFWIQVFRGAVLAFLAFFAAPVLADFFDEPRINNVLRVLALVEIIRGFQSIGVVLLEREINFRARALLDAAAGVVRIITTIILAWYLRSVWALVFGMLAGEATMLVLSYLVHSFRPKLEFKWHRAKELFDFGVWLFLAGIVGYVSLQADNVFVGKWLSTEALGIYYMAYKVANLFVTEIATPLGKVLKPAYAMIQGSQSSLQNGLEKTLVAFLIIFLPISLFLVTTADIFVPVLLGIKWQPIVPILPVLAVGAFFFGIASTGQEFFIGTGRPKLVFYADLARAICLTACLYPFYAYAGLLGVAYASMFSTATMLALVGYNIRGVIRVRRFLRWELLPIGLAAVALGICLIGQTAVFPTTWPSLVLMVASAGTIYVGTIWLLVGESAHIYGLKVYTRRLVRRLLHLT